MKEDFFFEIYQDDGGQYPLDQDGWTPSSLTLFPLKVREDLAEHVKALPEKEEYVRITRWGLVCGYDQLPESGSWLENGYIQPRRAVLEALRQGE